MKETREFIINSHDEDAFGRVRASCVLRYMQEAANIQLYRTHPTPAELAAQNRAFILSKLNMEIYDVLHAYDHIRVDTWITSAHGVMYDRCYRMLRDGQVVAEAAAVWALIERGGRIVRVSECDCSHHFDSEICTVPAPRHMKLPDLEYTPAGVRRIYYSDIDSNGHMNNTNYPDMLCSHLPGFVYTKGSVGGERVSSLRISFISEAPLGETLTIYTAEDGGKKYFRTIRADNTVNIEAEMTTVRV